MVMCKLGPLGLSSCAGQTMFLSLSGLMLLIRSPRAFMRAPYCEFRYRAERRDRGVPTRPECHRGDALDHGGGRFAACHEAGRLGLRGGYEQRSRERGVERA